MRKNHKKNHWPRVDWFKEADIVGVTRPARGVITAVLIGIRLAETVGYYCDGGRDKGYFRKMGKEKFNSLSSITHRRVKMCLKQLLAEVFSLGLAEKRNF